MATLTVSFLDINGDPVNSGYTAHSKGSEHGFTLRFRVMDGDTPASFDMSTVYAEIDKISLTGPIADHEVNDWSFEDYPCKFNKDDLADMLSLDTDTMIYSLRLPYGAPPDDLAPESISVPAIAVSYGDASAGYLNGTYVLMAKEEVSSELNIDISNYNGYNKIYKLEDEESGTVRYIRARSAGNGMRWCISNTIKDISGQSNQQQYIIIASDSTGEDWEGSNSRDEHEDDPAADLCMYKRSDDGDGSAGEMPGYRVYTNTGFKKNEADSEHSKEKLLYFRMGDGMNSTDVSEVNIRIWMIGPDKINLMLTGSSGSGDYSGFRKKDGRYFPSQYVKATMSAASDLPIRCRLAGSSVAANYDGMSGTTKWMKLVNGEQKTAAVKIVPHSDSFLNHDTTTKISLIVEDDAGNSNVSDPETDATSSDSDTIQVMTRLFRTNHEHLVEETSSDRYKVFTAVGASLTLIPQTVVSTDPNDYTRSWNEIWYPETHGAPLNEDGTIDVEKATRISKPTTDSTGVNGPTPSELLRYDRLAMDSEYERLLTDNDGRYYTAAADWSNSKTYPSMVNSRLSDGVFSTYWIIDNTGNPDFRLEFEYFDFSGDVTALPSNLVAPYDGDMLCVYDASDPDAVNVLYDSDGNASYTLRNSSKLVRLFTIKGSYNPNAGNPITMVDSSIPGALTMSDCGFITPNISSCSRICLVPFTDYGDTGTSVGSGFKLKAGPKHMATRENFEYSSETGEFWIHLSPQTSTSGKWSSANEVAIDYKYYGSFATTDCEAGTVALDTRIEYPMLATFNAYMYLGTDGSCSLPYGRYSAYDSTEGPDPSTGHGHPHCIRKFATTEDDYVDYIDPAFYVEPAGLELDTGNYDGAQHLAGKMVRGYSCNKDTGILTIDDSITTPLGRLFGKYSYHTFYRLTSDGYGDLHFYGTGILVPATVSNNYTDWAYVDLRIINEGTNTLHDGLLQFLSRGYITTGSVVDTVLDNNRPWDVQEGTAAETVQRTGGRVATSYSQLKTSQSLKATRTNAFNARASQSVVLGTIEPKGMVYVRVFWCIANNAEGTAWIDVTRGKKVFSAELAGRFYLFSN